MKYRLIDLLVCPACKSEKGFLVCAPSKEERVKIEKTKGKSALPFFTKPACGEWCALKKTATNKLPKKNLPCAGCFEREIVTGSLKCQACGEEYHITNGIPRMLVGKLRSSSVAAGASKQQQELLATMKSFGYQWQEYDELYDKYREYFLDFVHPFGREFFKGKLSLDVGCGTGRFCHFSHEFGAEVVGVDLSEAVEAAYKNNRKNPRVYIVQGNIYELPFRKKFGLIYCLGVIQHLPDKEGGFQALARLRNSKTTLFIWVYGKRYDIYRLIDFMRPVTTKMPHRMLSAFCYIPAAAQVAMFNMPYRALKSVGLKDFAEKIPYRRYAEYPFRHNVADWFDRLSVPLTAYFGREDLERWFRNAGIDDFVIIPRGYGWRAWTPSKAPDGGSHPAPRPHAKTRGGH